MHRKTATATRKGRTVTANARLEVGDTAPAFSLTDADGKGLQIEGIQPICFSATDIATEELDPGLTKKQQHPSDLRPHDAVFLHIDLKQRGVGGDNSWGALPHEQYRLLDKQYTYGYVMRLIQGK